jgi:hypothetical protein
MWQNKLSTKHVYRCSLSYWASQIVYETMAFSHTYGAINNKVI